MSSFPEHLLKKIRLQFENPSIAPMILKILGKPNSLNTNLLDIAMSVHDNEDIDAQKDLLKTYATIQYILELLSEADLNGLTTIIQRRFQPLLDYIQDHPQTSHLLYLERNYHNRAPDNMWNTAQFFKFIAFQFNQQFPQEIDNLKDLRFLEFVQQQLTPQMLEFSPDTYDPTH